MLNRRRRQTGYLYKAAGIWYVRHHDDRMEDGLLVRKQVSSRIGLVRDFPAKELARREAEKILRPINERTQRPEAVQSIAVFAEQHYFPFCADQINPSTLTGYKARWRQLAMHIGNKRLRDTTPLDIQQVLTGIHRQSGLNRDSIRALRGLLKLIFDHAITMGILDRNTVNPVLGTKVPRSFALAKQPSETHAYTLPEIFGMLNVLEEPARTAVATAAFTGVRRGELAGLLWEDFNPKGCVSENGATMGSIKISRSVWEGHITNPKTKKSKAAIPTIPFLAKILEAHRLRTGKPIAGPIFASATGTPLNMNNLLHRGIMPILNRCGICGKPPDSGHDGHEYGRDGSLPEWHGFHAFRRGLGTNLKGLGVDLKTIQDILRHAHISTTADIYVKEVSADSVKAMLKFERKLNAYRADGGGKQSKSTQKRLILQ
jgi:integrase